MQRLDLSSIWALLAAFEDPLPVPSIGSAISFEGAFVKGIDSLSWMANNTTKLFGSQSSGPHCWTFFSTAAFGKQNKVPQVSSMAVMIYAHGWLGKPLPKHNCFNLIKVQPESLHSLWTWLLLIVISCVSSGFDQIHRRPYYNQSQRSLLPSSKISESWISENENKVI